MGGERGSAALTFLKVGDAAPGLAFERALSGTWAELAHEPERGKVYVLEFWATWCSVCRRSLKGLDELVARHAGKGMIALAVNGVDGRGETLERAERFIAGLTTKPTFPMVFDKGPATRGAYLRPARITGLPAAFVIDKEGRIAWIGNPVREREDFERVVDECVNDRFDRSAAVERFKGVLARRAEEDERASGLQVKLREATRAGDHAGAMAAMDALMALDRERFGRLAISRFEVMLRGRGDADGAVAYARTVIEGDGAEEAEVLEQLAWALLDVPALSALPAARVTLALTAAEKAADLTLMEDDRALDTLARAWSAKGDLAKAEGFASKAAAKSIGTPRHEQIRARLEGYRARLKER
ncbi:MAG: TlpA disulfide reductase family protein [Phycisphaerales bacterium]